MSDQRNMRRLDEKRLEKMSGALPKRIPGATGNAPVPSCMSCRFMWDTGIDPNTLKQTIECRWGPPNVTTLPMNGGVARMTSAPTPPPDYWCWRHEPIENAPALIAGP